MAITFKSGSGIGGGGGGSWGTPKKEEKKKTATTLGMGGSRAPVSTPTSYSTPSTPTQSYTAPKTNTTAATSNITPVTPVVEQSAPSWLGTGTVGGGGSGSGGSTSIGTANSAYQQALDALREQERAEQERARLRTQATIDNINSNVPKINQDYEGQQTENYITHTKNMFGMGDFLRAQGYSGGMSESKAGELTANYETSRNSANQAKNNALENIKNLIAQAQVTGDENLATIASSANTAYQNLLAQQANAELQAEQTATAQSIDNARYQDTLTQQGFENDLATKEYLLAAQKAKVAGTSATGTSGTSTYTGGTDDDTQTLDSTKVTQIINGLGNYMAGRGTNQAAITYVQQLLNSGSINQAEYNYILNKFGYRM